MTSSSTTPSRRACAASSVERAHVKIGTVLVTEFGHALRQPSGGADLSRGDGRGRAGLGVRPIPTSSKYGRARLASGRSGTPQAAAHPAQEISHLDRLSDVGGGRWRPVDRSVAENLIPAAINYLRYTPNPTLKEIYFLAFKARDRSACERVFEAFCAKGALTRLGSR